VIHSLLCDRPGRGSALVDPGASEGTEKDVPVLPSTSTARWQRPHCSSNKERTRGSSIRISQRERSQASCVFALGAPGRKCPNRKQSKGRERHQRRPSIVIRRASGNGEPGEGRVLPSSWPPALSRCKKTPCSLSAISGWGRGVVAVRRRKKEVQDPRPRVPVEAAVAAVSTRCSPHADAGRKSMRAGFFRIFNRHR